MFNNKINRDDLRTLQMDILDYIKNICEKYDIKYYLFYGTLLGSIRHGGYIPWDDDIDIALMRKDYDKLLKILKENKNDKYDTISMINDNCFFPYAKVINTTTILVDNIKTINNIIGVYVDIFPIDNVKNNKFVTYIQNLVLIALKNMSALNKFDYYQRISLKNSIANILILLSKKIGIKKLKILMYKIQTLFNNKYTKYIGIIPTINIKKEIFERKWFESSVECKFENRKYPVPKKYNLVLEKLYGQYMKMPPISERRTVHNQIIIWK